MARDRSSAFVPVTSHRTGRVMMLGNEILLASSWIDLPESVMPNVVDVSPMYAASNLPHAACAAACIVTPFFLQYFSRFEVGLFDSTSRTALVESETRSGVRSGK